MWPCGPDLGLEHFVLLLQYFRTGCGGVRRKEIQPEESQLEDRLDVIAEYHIEQTVTHPEPYFV